MTHDFQSDIDAVGRIPAVPLILDVVCRTTGMRFAAVARVTEDRWVACQVADQIELGLQPGSELEIATTFCDQIRASGRPVIIDHVAEDAEFSGHPIPAQYGFQSYISMPILRSDGRFFGTLCALDPRPANVNNPETIGMFKLFAELIASHLDAGEQLATVEARLSDERKLSELREQFIAVLGHDLRNPIAAIDAGTKLLLRTPLEDKARRVVTAMQSSASRMAGLVNNVLDFARGRLGGGFAVQVRDGEPLEPVLREVIAELQAVEPERTIETTMDMPHPVASDPARMAQLLSNLLGNALRHGSADAPVRVSAISRPDFFELSVSNAGEPIPPAVMDSLFLPFFRGDEGANAGHRREGLGLGLYIASEIAKAHHGTLEAHSTERETRFTFRMPLLTMDRTA